MTTRNSPDDPISATHRDFYRDQRSANYWASYSDQLLGAEASILGTIASDLKDKPLLDVGVGGGRTTPHLLQISQDYLGIDFSAAMVAACQRKFPGISFLQCDARAMGDLESERFSLVFFSFNGIDCLNHADRQKVYRAALEALAPGGYFLFSAHNLRDEGERNARPWHYRWPNAATGYGERLDLLRHTYHYVVQNVHYLLHSRKQVLAERYCILLERGQRYKTLMYYIDPDEQVRQLEAAGFADIGVYDRNGAECPPDSPALDRVNPVHYLARKR